MDPLERHGDRLAAMIAAAIARDQPHETGRLVAAGDGRSAREVAPIFFGAYDWHSAVHGHWALVRLGRHLPAAPWTAAIRATLDAAFTADAVRAELAHLAPRPGFELPYGLAWLLTLGAELHAAARDGDAACARWRASLAPLVAHGRARLRAWLADSTAPDRSGQHDQAAFAVGLTLDHGRIVGDGALVAAAEDWIHRHVLAPGAAARPIEPGPHDFLSPLLAEADLARRVLPPPDLATWLDRELPAASLARLAPVQPRDRSDGKLVHADGLNLSRAWMLQAVAERLSQDHPRAAALFDAAAQHARAGLDGIHSDAWAGAHWLGSFAVYLLSPPRPPHD
jgi:hypothetical protein